MELKRIIVKEKHQKRLNKIIDILASCKTGKKLLEFCEYTLEKKDLILEFGLISRKERRENPKLPRGAFIYNVFLGLFKIELNPTYSDEFLACGLAHELVHFIQANYLSYMNSFFMEESKDLQYSYFIWPEFAAYKMTRIVALELNLREAELMSIEHGQGLIDMLNCRYRLIYLGKGR